MNKISLKEFYEKAAQDPALGEKLAALSRELDEKLRALAAGAGFELEDALPLSDEEAADAAGGNAWRDFETRRLMDSQRPMPKPDCPA